jgi:hypothetical protein
VLVEERKGEWYSGTDVKEFADSPRSLLVQDDTSNRVYRRNMLRKRTQRLRGRRRKHKKPCSVHFSRNRAAQQFFFSSVFENNKGAEKVEVNYERLINQKKKCFGHGNRTGPLSDTNDQMKNRELIVNLNYCIS